MQRVTITVDDELAAELDRFMAARGYANRSEAIRDLARSGLQQAATEVGSTRPCVAALVYLYDHEARELPKRLTRDFHERHDLAHTTLARPPRPRELHGGHGAQGPRRAKCSSSPTASSPSAGCATAMWSICRLTARTPTAMARVIATARSAHSHDQRRRKAG